MSLRAGRFFRTPKGLLILALAVLTGLGAAGAGFVLVAPGLVGAIGTAMLIDAPILRARHHRWEFPDGALLTGLIIAAVLSPREPWSVAAATAAVGIASKYAFRLRNANVFNPAAFGLLATFYVFDTGQSWWGALPEVTPFALVVLVATGVFITWKVKKASLVLAFLGSYYALVTAVAFMGNPAHVAELYRAPDLHAALYFAFFMLTDPPTSPPRERDQLAYGVITGAASFAAFIWIGAAYWLLAGVLVSNAWNAARLSRTRRIIADGPRLKAAST